MVLRPEPAMLIHLSASRGHGEIAVAGADRDAVDRVTDDLIAALCDPEPHDDEVPFTFWAGTPGGPMNPRRRVSAPTWAEIRANYGPAARDTLDGLMAATEPGPGGLLLWHGEPGTGKSYALRALAREWREWCEMHFITDADAVPGRPHELPAQCADDPFTRPGRRGALAADRARGRRRAAGRRRSRRRRPGALTAAEPQRRSTRLRHAHASSWSPPTNPYDACTPPSCAPDGRGPRWSSPPSR